MLRKSKEFLRFHLYDSMKKFTYSLTVTITNWYLRSWNILDKTSSTTTCIIMCGLRQLSDIETNNCVCFRHHTTSLYLLNFNELPFSIDIELQLDWLRALLLRSLYRSLKLFLLSCIRLGLLRLHLKDHVRETKARCFLFFLRRTAGLKPGHVSHVHRLHQNLCDALL